MKRLRLGHSGQTEVVELNMAPLIDMIFILLIFFLVTTSFVKESGVEVQRPIAATAQRHASTNLIIAVTTDGQVFSEKRPIDIRSMRSYMERFLAETPNGTVVIAADRMSMTGIVIQVLDACRVAGVKNVTVAARIP
jgi:biopolymer transport protein ExbD